jgi:hypothetical protein
MKKEKTKSEITFNESLNVTFNEWAKELKVSTMWDDTKPENINFIERLTMAREYYFSSLSK